MPTEPATAYFPPCLSGAHKGRGRLGLTGGGRKWGEEESQDGRREEGWGRRKEEKGRRGKRKGRKGKRRRKRRKGSALAAGSVD